MVIKMNAFGSHIDRMWAIVVRSVIDSRSAQRDSAVTA